jgi:hypothetical protein
VAKGSSEWGSEGWIVGLGAVMVILGLGYFSRGGAVFFVLGALIIAIGYEGHLRKNRKS